MATDASHLYMRTVKRIICLARMVEIPCLPASRVVTGFAFPAQRAFVYVVAIVAFRAQHGRVFVCGRAMTRFTLRPCVRSGKFEFRLVVVVGNTRPFPFVVARFALASQLVFVRVVLSMARDAIHRQRLCAVLDVEFSNVARDTFGERVRISQNVPGGLSVIER